ncbi:hypothetical protein [Undibacterium sp. TS12]|uniref:hypothetical protein n=1 Tax=Undibacterium sp. TS12 TaxID=2908202 RepID=UPI001F4D22A7|nr:hypothetical protein [Undibacterium sp. TS12]MCH8620731.1 hypothetical protein [Undibacterium sp. TS12]
MKEQAEIDSAFPPHGQFRLYLDGRILVTEVQGPWNVELVRRWAAEVRPYSLQLMPDGPWAGLALIKGSMLSTPEGMEVLAEITANGAQNLGCVANVVVAAADVAGRGVIESQFQRIYEGVCAYGFFYEIDEARRWLNALLASLTDTAEGPV